MLAWALLPTCIKIANSLLTGRGNVHIVRKEKRAWGTAKGAGYYDLNADSVDIVDLSMALEEEFDIDEMSEEEASAIKTVGDLVRFLQNKID